jgi:hypothetical protein
MASTIIGTSLTASTTSKVLKRQNFSKEPNGLETIIEVYAIKTENRDAIVPARDVVHSSFSSGTEKYSRMAVESVNTEEQDGGITEMSVTYVGMTASTGLPPAIVRLIPNTSEGVFGPKAVIDVEFLYFGNQSQFMLDYSGGVQDQLFSVVDTYQSMPSSINGTALPVNPKTPYIQAPNGGGAGVILDYRGYVQLSSGFTRRGQFLVANLVYHELLMTSQVGIGSTTQQ